MSEIIIYEDADGQSVVQVRLGGETVWLTQKQMSELFGTTSENIIMHLKRIFMDAELNEKATTKDFLVVQTEGKRQAPDMTSLMKNAMCNFCTYCNLKAIRYE